MTLYADINNNNTINNTWEHGIFSYGLGTTYIHDNVVNGSGILNGFTTNYQVGKYGNDNLVVEDDTKIKIIDNSYSINDLVLKDKNKKRTTKIIGKSLKVDNHILKHRL